MSKRARTEYNNKPFKCPSKPMKVVPTELPECDPPKSPLSLQSLDERVSDVEQALLALLQQDWRLLGYDKGDSQASTDEEEWSEST